MREGRRRRNRHEIDFKMADFANSVTAGDLAKDKPCPPQHPNQPTGASSADCGACASTFCRSTRHAG